MAASGPKSEIERLLDAWEQRDSVSVAAGILGEIEQHGGELPDGMLLGDFYEDLAGAAADERDYVEAVRLQRRVIELGSSTDALGAQAYLGWYLLDAGEREDGRRLLDGLVEAHPANLALMDTVAAALHEHAPEEALVLLDATLARAPAELGTSGFEAVRRLRTEREHLRRELGLPLDRGDLLAISDQATRIANSERPELHNLGHGVLMVPLDELPEARRRWASDDRADKLGDDRYRAFLEYGLRAMQQATGAAPLLLRITVDELSDAGLRPLVPTSCWFDDEAAAEFRRAHANWVVPNARRARVAWPPSRNDICWCGSQAKYKRCCGAR